MKRTIGRLGTLLGLALCALGCVERKFVIEAYPVGDPKTILPAQVLHNGKPIGFSPVDEPFVYYGKHNFTLIRDGFETVHLTERIVAPWYQYPLIDFFAENVYPFKIRDIRRLRIPMQPLQQVVPGAVLLVPQELRVRGQQIGDAAPRPTQTANPLAPVSGGVVGARGN